MEKIKNYIKYIWYQYSSLIVGLLVIAAVISIVSCLLNKEPEPIYKEVTVTDTKFIHDTVKVKEPIIVKV